MSLSFYFLSLLLGYFEHHDDHRSEHIYEHIYEYLDDNFTNTYAVVAHAFRVPPPRSLEPSHGRGIRTGIR